MPPENKKQSQPKELNNKLQGSSKVYFLITFVGEMIQKKNDQINMVAQEFYITILMIIEF